MEQPIAQERAHDRALIPALRSTGAPAPARPAPLESAAEPGQIAARLRAQSNQRERRLRIALSLADAAAVMIALPVGHILSPDSNIVVPLLLLPAVVAAAKIVGLYESDDQRIRKTTAEEMPRLAQLGAWFALAALLLDGRTLDQPSAAGQVLLLGGTFVVGAVLGRRAARRHTNRKLPRERCLFIGDNRSYLRLSTIFVRHELPADLVACVPVDAAMLDGGSDVAGESRALLDLVARSRAHRLIIGPHALTNDMTFGLVEAARDIGTRVSLLPDMLEVVGSSVDFDDLYGMTLLGVRHTQLSRSSRRLKRTMDLIGAALVLIATAPLMAVIAIAIRRDSSGPAVFRQSRVGRDGQAFDIFKFRTMVEGADELKDQLRTLNQADGLFKIDDDPRITRLGRFLRRTSLDELPQIFNVLRGQMSLVGPRPLVADESRTSSKGLGRGRLRLTPGMTGQWQISGSSRIPLEDMVKLDHLYVSNWTLWGDVKILLRTVPYVLSRRGQ